MARSQARASKPGGWASIADPPDRFSSGIADFDRLLGGGFGRGSFALFNLDSTVRQEDLDRLFFPTFLNALYQSRGIITVLPSRDSPRAFRSRMLRHVTRRRFDARVRVIEYVGEDEGPPYVVSLASMRGGADHSAKGSRALGNDMKKMVDAERAAQGDRKRPYVEVMAFEVADTLVGSEQALKMFFNGIKRSRAVGNLLIGLLGPGLGSAAGVKRMADSEFELRRDELGLTIRGIYPAFSGHLVVEDPTAGAPRVAFVPRPA
jgi:hypothetical protein